METADLDPATRRRLSAVPIRYRALYRKALAGRVSPRTAIKLHCCECMGWEGTGTGGLAGEIRRCTSRACPLHAYRPFVQVRQVAEGASKRPQNRRLMAKPASEPSKASKASEVTEGAIVGIRAT